MILFCGVSPLCSEPRSPKFLIESFYTPNDMFFVRNHNPVPMIDEEDWELEVSARARTVFAREVFKALRRSTSFLLRVIVREAQVLTLLRVVPCF